MYDGMRMYHFILLTMLNEIIILVHSTYTTI